MFKGMGDGAIRENNGLSIYEARRGSTWGRLKETSKMGREAGGRAVEGGMRTKYDMYV